MGRSVGCVSGSLFLIYAPWAFTYSCNEILSGEVCIIFASRDITVPHACSNFLRNRNI